MFLVTRRRECAGRREWSSSKNAAVTLESLPEESGRNCCLSMLHGRETNLPCLSDITQIRCSFQETFRKLLRASLTSCAFGGARYRFVVSRGTFYLFYLTRSKHSEASYRRKAETLGMRPLSLSGGRQTHGNAHSTEQAARYYERKGPRNPSVLPLRHLANTLLTAFSMKHSSAGLNERKRRNARFRASVVRLSGEGAFRASPPFLL